MPKEFISGHNSIHSRSRNGFNEHLDLVREPKGRARHKDRRAWIKGIRSVQKVVSVLHRMSEVSEIYCTRPNSEDDLKGKDIIARAIGVGEFFIQVKSSKSHIRRFKQVMGLKHRIDPNNIDRFLLNQRIIVVDGSSNAQNIEGSLTNYLNMMTASSRRRR